MSPYGHTLGTNRNLEKLQKCAGKTHLGCSAVLSKALQGMCMQRECGGINRGVDKVKLFIYNSSLKCLEWIVSILGTMCTDCPWIKRYRANMISEFVIMQQSAESCSSQIYQNKPWYIFSMCIPQFLFILHLEMLLQAGARRPTCSPVGSSELMEACLTIMPDAEADNKIKIQLWCHGDLEEVFTRLNTSPSSSASSETAVKKMLYYTLLLKDI